MEIGGESSSEEDTWCGFGQSTTDMGHCFLHNMGLTNILTGTHYIVRCRPKNTKYKKGKKSFGTIRVFNYNRLRGISIHAINFEQVYDRRFKYNRY